MKKMILSFLIYFLIYFNSDVESFRSSYNIRHIIGGESADITEFPYQLSLETAFFFFDFACGASIIHHSWALTAAHCIPKLRMQDVRLRAGSNYTMRGGTLHYATKIIIHPLFDRTTIEYDASIIKVYPSFQYSDVTQKILMASRTPLSGTPALVSGWGSINCNLTLPKQLQKLDVYTIDYKDCKTMSEGLDNFVTPNMLCAHVPEGGKNVFYGDSGGPLVVGNYQVGIVSYGLDDSFESLPAVYTDVSKIHEWVTSTIETESRSD